ncbi:hypothetical protein NQ314_020096, partial [Rhamnusium bicolor]
TNLFHPSIFKNLVKDIVYFFLLHLTSHNILLGHKILEIRERALFNIISKLDNGVLFDNDLARSREILTKLFQWFLFEPCTQEEAVFTLLKRILKSESGRILINHCGKSTLRQELCQIRSYLEPTYYSHLDELCTILNQVQEEQPLVPPLECEVPLSYRTDASSANQVENLSTPSDYCPLNDNITLHISRSINETNNKNILPNYLLKWQPLIEPDRHVLQSVENSLRDPPQPSVLLHSCEFFTNVLLHDFPAEIFLQRPTIILEFYSLMMYGSTRITNAVLNCLCDLTRALHVRINHCNDVAMQNLRIDTLYRSNSVCDTALLGTNKNPETDEISSDNREKLERFEDVKELQRNQFSIPKYCFVTVAAIFKYLCVKQDTFRENKVKTNQYGEALEYFRLESITSEINLIYRVVYLYLLHNTANLLRKQVPLSRTGLILPRNLKHALSNSLLDVTLGRLYPEVHNIIFEYVQSFCVNGEVDPLKKYKDVKKICNGMTATVKFLKQHKSLSTSENFRLAKVALPSIEFHKEFDFLKVLVEICSEKCSVISDDSTKNVMEVEISAFGITNKNFEIQRYAEDILIYILKCKVLVCESVWNKIIEALIPSLPIIACHTNKSSPLGKSIMTLMDPDMAVNVCMPPIAMLKCNIQFLFANDAYLRDEAFSRIYWLMASQENSREMLPKFNTLYDKALANVCHLKRVVDVNKVRYTEHFYQPSSLHQVMEVLNSQNVEPVLRRSALNQVSVMMEDPLLHQIFLDANGIELVTDVMKTALTEQDYRDYPDSIIPIASILKNICLYHSSIRGEPQFKYGGFLLLITR